MLLHYLKIAYRNHVSHKIQSLITLFSMAISFAFVALVIYWNHYEHTYDSFLADHDRIYLIGDELPDKSLNTASFFGFHTYLMDNYPEVEKACGVYGGWTDDTMVEINNHIVRAGCEKITPEAIDVFGIQWIEGKQNMESWNENEVAISEKIAQEVCGNESPVGQKLILKESDGETVNEEYRIAAVFETWPQHSNFSFHVLKKLVPDPLPYRITMYETYVRFHSEKDSRQFLHKLKNDTYIDYKGIDHKYDTLIPMREVRLKFNNGARTISLNDMKLFTGATVLLAVCALLNYLTLFISRLRNRGRDMALRTICGSSIWQTSALLMVEYLLLLFASLLVSLLFIELFFDYFVKVSQLKLDRLTVYGGCGYLLIFILGLSTMLSLVPILYFKNKTFRIQIESSSAQPGRNRFRIAGVCMQLFISIIFIFCSTVMIKQVHYLIYADINIERKNIAVIRHEIGDWAIIDILKTIPSITEMVTVDFPLFPNQEITSNNINEYDGRKVLNLRARLANINKEIALFYGLKMKEGQESFDLKLGECLINETFAKQLNDPNPIGKTFIINNFQKFVIKGILYDFQHQHPKESLKAIYFRQQIPTFNDGENSNKCTTVAFKYIGEFTDCQAAIEKALDKATENIELEDIKGQYNKIEDGETVYNSYLTKEMDFLKLLNVLTVISLMIALFGVYALILQECERQRKNIAIRKVYGAQVKDILIMFFKEYIMQVMIAAAFAFPIGYMLMNHWLEGYSRQTSVGIGVFLGIFIGMSILVMFCIGWHVWRAANENPATAVKNG